MGARLAVWDRLVRADVAAPDRLVRPARVSKTILCPGADEPTLQAAERRLGVALPASYRDFLAHTDGAYADPSGAVTELLASSDSVPVDSLFGFLPADQLTRLTADLLPDGALEAWTRDPDIGRPLARGGDLVADTGPLLDPRVIAVTTLREWRGAVLVPVGDATEWQLWCLSRDEIIGYHSFESWLERIIHTPGVEHVMDLIRWFRDKDPRGEQLRTVRDPAALPILLATIEEFPDERTLIAYCISALGRIKSESAIAAIEPWVRTPIRNYAVGALLRIKTPAAIDALARQDAHHELLLLGDPRAGECAIRALQGKDLSGAGTLASLGDPAYIPVLLDALREKRADDPLRRARLAAALYACGAPEGRRTLEQMASDPDSPERVREIAAWVHKPPTSEHDAL